MFVYNRIIMGWEITKTEFKCGCIKIKKEHDFFNDTDEYILYCEEHKKAEI